MRMVSFITGSLGLFWLTSIATAFNGASISSIRPAVTRNVRKVRTVRMNALDGASANQDPAMPMQALRRRVGRTQASKAAIFAGGATAAAMLATSLGASPAWAKAAATTTTEHLHLGQKVAQFFRGFGLADTAVITLIAAMPVVELRGAIPVGIWMGIPMAKVFALCVLGNMLPIAPLLFALRFGPVQKLMKPILDRAQSKAEAAFADPKSRALLLAAFVGIPLPGTGAWTGAMGAFLLGMPFTTAFASIFAGVFCSGCIMTAISCGGIFGAGVGAVLLGSMLTQVRAGGKSTEAAEDTDASVSNTEE